MRDRRGRLLLVTVNAALLPAPDLPVVRAIHRWLDTWRGLGDQLLTAKEAAIILKVSPDFLRRSPVAKPFRVYVGREPRFTARGIQQGRIVR